MGKETKTNAVRILDRNKINYELITYECDEFVDGLHTAEITGAPVDKSYKTLVMQGKSKQYYVFVIQIANEVDLKAAARVVGEKSVEMIHVKDITAITGYVMYEHFVLLIVRYYIYKEGLYFWKLILSVIVVSVVVPTIEVSLRLFGKWTSEHYLGDEKHGINILFLNYSR